ncbi:TIGR03915 family putative DNA repair protein [Paeniroseomonas aquatica]
MPRGFLDLAEVAIRHRDPERFALLYRLLWRLTHGEAGLLQVATDPEVIRAQAMAKAVRRDAHKLHAFLRFRMLETESGTRYIAWFEPDHHILEAETGFFIRRFAGMRWSILTPEASAHWDGEAVRMGPGGRRADAPAEDAQEVLWRAYYAHIFNPARLKPAAMRAEMPKKYWRNLPEAQDIARLMAEAPRRVAEMVERGATPAAARRQRAVVADVEAAMPDLFSQDPAQALAALRAEVLADRGPLAVQATQAVFGEGPIGAALLFVGEQPGDEEDIAGRPFVGPAGRMFNRALEEAGVPREEAYVTNAVKHFIHPDRAAAAAPDAGCRRHHPLPALPAAGGGDRGAAAGGLARRDGAAGAGRQGDGDQQGARRGHPHRGRAAAVPDRAPLLPAAAAGCREQGARVRPLRRRPEGGLARGAVAAVSVRNRERSRRGDV